MDALLSGVEDSQGQVNYEGEFPPLQVVVVWFPGPPSGGEGAGSTELHVACTDPWHFNITNLSLQNLEHSWAVTAKL